MRIIIVPPPWAVGTVRTNGKLHISVSCAVTVTVSGKGSVKFPLHSLSPWYPLSAASFGLRPGPWCLSRALVS